MKDRRFIWVIVIVILNNLKVILYRLDFVEDLFDVNYFHLISNERKLTIANSHCKTMKLSYLF